MTNAGTFRYRFLDRIAIRILLIFFLVLLCMVTTLTVLNARGIAANLERLDFEKNGVTIKTLAEAVVNPLRYLIVDELTRIVDAAAADNHSYREVTLLAQDGLVLASTDLAKLDATGPVADFADVYQPLAALVNIAAPRESRVLQAPLATGVGGWGQCKQAWGGTAEAHSQEKTLQRLTAQVLMPQDILQRTL